jgi:3-dehydroquinate dehydratase-2
MKTRILVVHGPNLNLLGEREPGIYGTLTLGEIDRRIREAAGRLSATVRCYQANGEGEIIDFLHRGRKWAQGLLINPAAYTHYSIAIRDAIAAVGLPAVEVHLSDIRRREAFRRKSVIRAVCLAQVSGLGWRSYTVGLERLTRALRPRTALPRRSRS